MYVSYCLLGLDTSNTTPYRQNNLKSPRPLLAKEYKIELHIYHSGKRAQNRSRKIDFKKLEFRGYRISISLESMPLIDWTNRNPDARTRSWDSKTVHIAI
jgi:hypothetical protein